MRIHLVAVCGTGMGSVAGLLGAAGHEVTGSDVAFDPPMGPALARWGIRTVPGFDAQNLEPPPDLVIVGNVCRPDNVEARAARELGVRTTTMAHALAELVLAGTSPLVVAGTHGKTTTTAMASWLLDRAGLEPGFLIGGLPKNFDESFRLAARGHHLPLARATGSRRTPFVIEGDEYDTAFFEKTPKFWHYRPEVAIVTSIEHDHIDIYPDEASYHAAFRGFFERIPAHGLCIAHATDRAVVELVRAAGLERDGRVAWYALQGDELHGCAPHWLAAPAGSDASGQAFDLYAGGSYAGRGTLPVPGLHNLRNALACLAACCQGFGVEVGQALRALTAFEGVARRQELLGDAGGISVYDDFAHHPTAVAETLHALRSRHAETLARGGRLWAVYEPRSATACRPLHQQAYARAFAAADRAVLAPLGRKLPDGERLDLAVLARAIEAAGTPAVAAASLDAIVALIAAEARRGDVVALLSNGFFGGVQRRLVAVLAERP